MIQGTSDSGTSPLKGSYRYLSLVKILFLNSNLFQSYGLVSKIQDTTRSSCRRLTKKCHEDKFFTKCKNLKLYFCHMRVCVIYKPECLCVFWFLYSDKRSRWLKNDFGKTKKYALQWLHFDLFEFKRARMICFLKWNHEIQVVE